MTRRGILLAIALLTVMVIPTFTAMVVGVWGRQQTVQAIRSGCLRNSLRNVALINVTRASAKGNHLIATDPAQSHRTRTARRTESMIDGTAAFVLDGQTDQSDWRAVNATIDRQAVLYGIPTSRGRIRPFRCATAYPPARFIP